MVRNIFLKGISVAVNLVEGAVGIIAFACVHDLLIVEPNSDPVGGLGVYLFLAWLVILLVPNFLLTLHFDFRKKYMMIFQLLPFVIGAVIYIVFQIFY
ncbi:MAG: hypothetical protein IJU14_03015 [Clostridia bacterium]|nr:hypothetical protein [Clostridia bacterium]